MNDIAKPVIAWTLFRVGLFAAAASLAGYIPYKYATQLHAIQGLYAFLFPLSAVLAVAGIVLALQPKKACDCSAGVRAGIGVLAGLWLVTGVMCVATLADAVAKNPGVGLFATFHMLAQHVFLSSAIIAFAVAPRTMANKLGGTMPASSATESAAAVLSGN